MYTFLAKFLPLLTFVSQKVFDMPRSTFQKIPSCFFFFSFYGDHLFALSFILMYANEAKHVNKDPPIPAACVLNVIMFWYTVGKMYLPATTKCYDKTNLLNYINKVIYDGSISVNFFFSRVFAVVYRINDLPSNNRVDKLQTIFLIKVIYNYTVICSCLWVKFTLYSGKV